MYTIYIFSDQGQETNHAHLDWSVKLSPWKLKFSSTNQNPLIQVKKNNCNAIWNSAFGDRSDIGEICGKTNTTMCYLYYSAQ